MAYRISYEDIAVLKDAQIEASRVEIFDTEAAALKRARELLDDGDCRAIAVCDDSGEVLGGVRLQLKLGFTAD